MMARSFWMVLAILARVLTFMQTDLKKLVAYSRVTHITFLMIRLCTNNKVLFFNCLILSLRHGWVSMGIFFSRGSLSNHSNSRLSLLLGREIKFHWSIIFSGLILVINAALPPFPSFFTELITISSLISLRLFGLFFVFYRLIVCYYNTYIFIWISHYKNIEQIFNKANNSEALLFSVFCWLRIFTVFWIILI
jgi:NADH-quinone oxidoreductase subunit M